MTLENYLPEGWVPVRALSTAMPQLTEGQFVRALLNDHVPVYELPLGHLRAIYFVQRKSFEEWFLRSLRRFQQDIPT